MKTVLMTRPRLNGWDARKDERVMAVNTGLSKTVAGHLIRLVRDEKRRVARVVVEPLATASTYPTDNEVSAIRIAAKLLAQQARRCFGLGWVVEEWDEGGMA